MPTPIDASSLGIDFGHLAPEIILTLTAIAVVLLDLVARDKRILAWLSVAGVVVAGAAAIWLWTSDASGSSYSGVVITDLFGTFFKLVVLGGTLLSLLFSPAYVERRLSRFHGEYYGLLLLATVGMMLLVSMGELISIVLSLEIQTFALVALIALLKDARSTESALKFLLLSAVATAVMLYGMAILFGLTGTTFIADMPGVIAERVAEGGIANNLALILAGVLIIVGFGFKISSVPFQMWAPPVYEGAPTPIVGYLSVVSKAAGFAVLVRVFMIAFGESGLDAMDWPLLIGALAIASMTIGNIVAIVQTNIKRLLAYSTIAQAGYILIGVAAMGSGMPNVYELATSGVLFYLAAYTLSNLAAFGAVIALTPPNDDDSIENLTGGFCALPVRRHRPVRRADLPCRPPADGSLCRQDLPLLRGSAGRPLVAGAGRRPQQLRLRLLLPAPRPPTLAVRRPCDHDRILSLPLAPNIDGHQRRRSHPPRHRPLLANQPRHRSRLLLHAVGALNQRRAILAGGW